MDPAEPAAEARIRAAGRELVDSRPISRDVGAYREFIHASRGEFTVATDVYMRPRSEWFSDRSVCYLAAAKPVVTQDTAFGKFVPTGEGLFAYATMEEAVDALAPMPIIPATPRPRGGSRPSIFGAERVLGRLLADAGLA